MKKIILSTTITLGLVLSGCQSMKDNPNTAKGTGIGAAAGAVLGGVIGHQTGKRNEGALLGAAVGAALGGYAGKRMDKQAKELEKVAETQRTEQGLVSKMKSDILFDTGKADLKAEAKKDLAEMAGIMKKYPENILTVKGFTDSTGSQKVNDELSQKRADAVKKQLVSAGISENVISTRGLGPANPIADNGTADGRKQNRRVEIEVTVDQSKVPPEQK
ncbi:MAG: OmpA family protein [Bdellovibrionaceae bacterium]|nr:OmpA family protein [Pseudobdellovibrionaceae bacterium]